MSTAELKGRFATCIGGTHARSFIPHRPKSGSDHIISATPRALWAVTIELQRVWIVDWAPWIEGRLRPPWRWDTIPRPDKPTEEADPVSRSRSLHDLQTIDLQRDEIVKRSRIVIDGLKDTSDFDLASRRVAALEAAMERSAAALRALELERSAIRERIERDEKTLYDGRFTTPRELQGLKASIDSQRRRLVAIEDELLVALLERDDATSERDSAEESRRAAEAALAARRKALYADRDALKAEAIEIEARRVEARERVESGDLMLYDRLRGNRTLGGIAVARLAADGCRACGAVLPVQDAERARSQTVLVRCDSCERIIHA